MTPHDCVVADETGASDSKGQAQVETGWHTCRRSRPRWRRCGAGADSGLPRCAWSIRWRRVCCAAGAISSPSGGTCLSMDSAGDSVWVLTPRPRAADSLPSMRANLTMCAVGGAPEQATGPALLRPTRPFFKTHPNSCGLHKDWFSHAAADQGGRQRHATSLICLRIVYAQLLEELFGSNSAGGGMYKPSTFPLGVKSWMPRFVRENCERIRSPPRTFSEITVHGREIWRHHSKRGA